jgi:hypothetical protein
MKLQDRLDQLAQYNVPISVSAYDSSEPISGMQCIPLENAVEVIGVPMSRKGDYNSASADPIYALQHDNLFFYTYAGKILSDELRCNERRIPSNLIVERHIIIDRKNELTYTFDLPHRNYLKEKVK